MITHELSNPNGSNILEIAESIVRFDMSRLTLPRLFDKRDGLHSMKVLVSLCFNPHLILKCSEDCQNWICCEEYPDDLLSIF